MREIKFRAWDEQNKVMEYKVNVNDGKPVKYGYQWFNHGNTIYDSELMQYTGLKDKNGKEIYEGDICDGERDTIVQIVWMDTHGWGCKVLKGGTLSKGLTFPLWQWDKCERNGYRGLEVIGNIYENPELLKGA